MKQKTKLRVCNLTLIAATVLMLASSLQLEATGSAENVWVWIHVATGVMFAALNAWHIYLHYRWHQWGVRLIGSRDKRPVKTRWMTIFGILTLVTGLIATVMRIIEDSHSSFGGWHGKIGYIFLILIVIHIGHRLNYYSRR